MQIKSKIGNAEIEIVKAPFGQAEPIGLLFVEGQKEILFSELTWKAVLALFQDLKAKNQHTLATGEIIHWNGDVLFVKNEMHEMSIQMGEKEFEGFGMMIWFRSIDPY